MKVVIAGAGPAGLLLALHLISLSSRQQQIDIHIIEKRPDPRRLPPPSSTTTTTTTTLRSFPISLDSRGLSAIRQIPGLDKAIEKRGGSWTVGVSLHSNYNNNNNKKRKNNNNQNQKPPKAARRIPTTPRLRVDRNTLALAMLNEITAAAATTTTTTAKRSDVKIKLSFETSVEGVDFDKKCIMVTQKESDGGSTTGNNKKEEEEEEKIIIPYDILVGCDGARSTIRNVAAKQNLLTYQEELTSESYKSFCINRVSDDDKTYELEKDRVHVWMLKHQGSSGDGGNSSSSSSSSSVHRVISVPSSDNSDVSNGVYIFPRNNSDPFSSCGTAEDVMNLFETMAPNSLAKLVTEQEAQELIERPVSTTTMVKTSTLNVGNTVVLLGDAAHAVSASLGQGCNSALQDVTVFKGLLEEYNFDWEEAIPEYNHRRLNEAHAVYELSAYATPQTKLMRTEFLIRTILRKILPKVVANLIMRPLPMQALADYPDASYSEILSKTQWWLNRVKRSSSSPKQNELPKDR